MRCTPVLVLFSIALTAAGSACAQSAAPAKTPPAIINKLHAAVSEALKAPPMREFLDAAAFYPVGSTPQEFREFVDAEMKRYAQNLLDAKIPPQ